MNVHGHLHAGNITIGSLDFINGNLSVGIYNAIRSALNNQNIFVRHMSVAQKNLRLILRPHALLYHAMNTTALLRENPDPTDEEIRQYLAGNLCRCSGYEGQTRGIRAYLTAKKEGLV